MPKVSATLVNAAARGYGFYLIILGIATWAGGEERLSAPAFITARQALSWVPVSPHVSLGVVFLVVSVLILVPRSCVVGLYVATVVMLALAISFCVSLFISNLASTTGCVSYFYLAVIAAGLVSLKMELPR